MAMRLLLHLPRRSSISSALKVLHWLPIKNKILFKALALVHRALHLSSPGYLAKKFVLYLPSRELHSVSASLLSIPRFRHDRRGGKAFSFLAAKAWNELPHEL